MIAGRVDWEGDNLGLVVNHDEDANKVTLIVGCGTEGIMEYELDPITLTYLIDALRTADNWRTERS